MEDDEMEPGRRLVQVQLDLAVREKHGASDIAAQLAFQRDGDLLDLNVALGRRTNTYIIDLSVPDSWTTEDTAWFERRVRAALRTASGIPDLTAKQVVAMMTAEEAVRAVMPPARADELFLPFKAVQPAGWEPALRALQSAAKGATSVLVETAVKGFVKAMMESLGP